MIQVAQEKRSSPNSSHLLAPLPHAASYQIRCGKCGGITVCPVVDDAVRIICPACGLRLTLPGTIEARCGSCEAVSEYAHTLAGHCSSCHKCGASVMLGPLIGRAHLRRPAAVRHHHHRNRRSGRTLAFSDSAERAMILLAAALATLIFVLVISM